MRVLVLGNGGREHALCWKLALDPQVTQIFCAPGNAGTAHSLKTENLSIASDDIAALLAWAQAQKPALTVVGPEIPLVAGIVDQFEAAGLAIFGPNQAAAQVEGSKAFSKAIMKKYGIPTAASEHFSDYESALKYLAQQAVPIVIKADGLAAGKGVCVAQTQVEAQAFLKSVMCDQVFGGAGACVVIEEFMPGQEASVLALTDGQTILPFSPAQDHKQVGEGDTGPNTGGMGAYSPTPVMDSKLEQQVLDTVLRPMVDGLRAEGIVYKGILYAGLMIADGKARVVEFNCRLGDPETQCVLPRLDNHLAELLLAVVHGSLDQHTLRWKPGYCLNVVLASGGYPGNYEKGFEISGLRGGANDYSPLHEDLLTNVPVFHAGTTEKNGKIVTAGGRVLNVVGMGATLREAIDNTYAAIGRISFKGMHYRRDIGQRVLHKA